MRKIYWVSVRISFYILFLLLLLTGGLSLIVLYPLYAWFFARDLRVGTNKKLLLSMITFTYSFVYDVITNKTYRQAFPVQFASAPMSAPDLSKVRIRNDWPILDGSCNGCSRCCSMRDCPFIDEKHQCLFYGSLYWRYFNCGRFPESQKQIDYYNCPKWEIIHE